MPWDTSGHPESYDALGTHRAKSVFFPALRATNFKQVTLGNLQIVVRLCDSAYPGHPLVDLWPTLGYFSALPLGIAYVAYVQ
jgi:hypothetical protein